MCYFFKYYGDGVYEKVISFTDIFFINIIAVISGIAVILITIVNTLLMYIDSVKCKVMIGLTLVIVIIVSFIVGMIVDRNKEK